jgi:hypothetical protein
MIKVIHLLGENYINSIQRQPCVVHTLQLSVLKGLKQCKVFHWRVKSLQSFFWLPKQAQRLWEAQQNSQSNTLFNDEYTNPLDILTDVKTRWNSTYYTWKRVLKLHNSMKFVFAELLSKSDSIS